MYLELEEYFYDDNVLSYKNLRSHATQHLARKGTLAALALFDGFDLLTNESFYSDK